MKTLKCITVLFLTLTAFTTVQAQTPAQNKAALLKAYDYFNAKDFTNFATLLADNTVDYSAPQPVKGRDAVVAGIKEYLSAFPDYHVTVNKIVAEGNTVMALITSTGTMKNDLMGMPATGKSFSVMDVDIIEFDNMGKAVAHWSVQDPSVMMGQIVNKGFEI